MKNTLIDSRFKKNAVFNYASQLCVVGFAFVTTTIIARYAGMDVLGMMAIMIALSGILSNLLTFRTNEAVVTFYKRGKITGELGLCRLALVMGLTLDCAVGIVLFLLVYIFSEVIAELLLQQSGLAGGVELYSFVILATFVRGTAIGYLVADERFNFVSGVAVIEAFLKTLVLTLYLLLDQSIDFYSVILATLVASVSVTLVLLCFPAIKLVTELREFSTSFHMLGSYFSFSISTFVSSSLKAGNQNIDTIVVGYFVNPAGVGFYSLFRQFLAPISMVAAPFSNQIYPRFVQCVSDRTQDMMREAVSQGNRILFFSYVIAVGIVAPTLYFYGQWNELNFSNVHYVTFSLMAVGVLLIQQLWWARALSLSMDPRWSVHAGVLSMIVMVCAGLYLIRQFELLGAAATTVLSALVLTIYWNIKLRNV